MNFIKNGNTYFGTVDIDESIHQCLKAWAIKENIPSAFIWGLGALKDAELGFYHLHKKDYDRKLFKDEAELISLVGNISWHNGEPIVHIHVALGGVDFNVYGGHLFDSKVAVTAELFIQTLDCKVERVFQPAIGLNLLHCKI
jgi:predicted DNA-binding protein with PD1-like motif